MEVIWKEISIDNYGILKVSNTGEVFSIKSNRILLKRENKPHYDYYVLMIPL